MLTCNNLKAFWVFSLIFLLSTQKRVFINYSQDTQALQIAKLFLHDRDGFYVDIGAFDPILSSNSLDLYTRGWKGISIQASSQKFRRLIFVKENQIKIHYALNNQSSIVRLYDGWNTIDKDLEKKLINQQNTQKLSYQEVASLTMAQLCQRYFITSPNFLNLDVEGLSSVALGGNDWKNPLCRPEVIFSEFNSFDDFVNNKSGLKPPQEILKEQNYTLLKEVWGPKGITINQIYIANQKLKQYRKRFETNEKQFKQNYEDVEFRKIRLGLYNGLNLEVVDKPYDADKDPLYFHFCVEEQPVLLSKVVRFSYKISQKVRPIILFNFNPERSTIILESGYSERSEVIIQNRNYLKISVNYESNVFPVYIFDHNITKLSNVRVNQPLSNNYGFQLTKQNSRLSEIRYLLWVLLVLSIAHFAIFMYQRRVRKSIKNNQELSIQDVELK